MKDLIKFIHNLESLESLFLFDCQVFGNIENSRINTRARFALQDITLHESSTEFEILDLAKLFLQNDSLKQQLLIYLYCGGDD